MEEEVFLVFGLGRDERPEERVSLVEPRRARLDASLARVAVLVRERDPHERRGVDEPESRVVRVLRPELVDRVPDDVIVSRVGVALDREGLEPRIALAGSRVAALLVSQGREGLTVLAPGQTWTGMVELRVS